MKNIWDNFLNAKELDKSIVDIYDRVPSGFNSNNLFKPNVSEYLHQKGFMPVYPLNKKFAVVVSHDIDNLACDDIDLVPIKHFGGVKSALKLVKNEITNSFRIKTYRPNKNYIPKGMRDLALIEQKFKIPASYYFLSLIPGEEDFNYKVDEIKHIFDSITKVGGEIGLHGGHLAYNSATKMASEKKMLEEACNLKVTGYRNHYLRFDRSLTWNALAQNDFLYDTTYGDAYSPGFRNGMCYPFKPYDLNSNSFVNIIELPLVYMDCSAPKYMFLNDENAWNLFINLVDKVRSVSGVFTLLWHNTSLDTNGLNFYKRAIDYLAKLDPWFASGQQLVEHYIEKGYFETITNLLMDSKHERV